MLRALPWAEEESEAQRWPGLGRGGPQDLHRPQSWQAFPSQTPPALFAMTWRVGVPSRQDRTHLVREGNLARGGEGTCPGSHSGKQQSWEST